MPDFLLLCGIDNGYRIIKTGKDIEPTVIFIKHQTGRTTASQGNMVSWIRCKTVRFQLGGIEYANFTGAKSGDIQG